MSKTYYIFRHGETYYSKNVIPYGENELTAEILPEAKITTQKLAIQLQKFQIEKAFRSEFLRCRQTVEIIETNSSLKFEAEPLLNEFTESSFDVFEERMETVIQKLESLAETHIALCTHGANVAGFKKLLTGHEFTSHDLMYYPKTGVILVISEGVISEIDCNA